MRARGALTVLIARLSRARSREREIIARANAAPKNKQGSIQFALRDDKSHVLALYAVRVCCTKDLLTHETLHMPLFLKYSREFERVERSEFFSPNIISELLIEQLVVSKTILICRIRLKI